VSLSPVGGFHSGEVVVASGRAVHVLQPDGSERPGWPWEPSMSYTEVHMELTKKTTILLSPEMHARLSELAAQKGVSLGALIRSACEKEYGVLSEKDRIDAVRELAALALPVGSVDEMKRESVPDPDSLVP